jgi:hypothetical protein
MDTHTLELAHFADGRVRPPRGTFRRMLPDEIRALRPGDRVLSLTGHDGRVASSIYQRADERRITVLFRAELVDIDLEHGDVLLVPIDEQARLIASEHVPPIVIRPPRALKVSTPVS